MHGHLQPAVRAQVGAKGSSEKQRGGEHTRPDEKVSSSDPLETGGNDQNRGEIIQGYRDQ